MVSYRILNAEVRTNIILILLVWTSMIDATMVIFSYEEVNRVALLYQPARTKSIIMESHAAQWQIQAFSRKRCVRNTRLLLEKVGLSG